MTAIYQGEGAPMWAVGQAVSGQLPAPVEPMNQGGAAPVMSDLQMMQADERRQHEQNYIYEHGAGQ